MYWYYKWPLVIIFLLLAAGLGSLVWRSCLPSKQPAPSATTPSTAPTQSSPPASSRTEQTTQSTTPSPSPSALPGSSEVATPIAHPTPEHGQSNLSNADEQRLFSAERQMLSEQPLAARSLAQMVFDNNVLIPGSLDWQRVTSIINEANRIFMNSAAPCPEKSPYIITTGDSLSRIANKQNTTVGALIRLNELDPTNQIIHPGNIMHTLKGTWSIKVLQSQYLLLLYLDGQLYRVYSVGIGRQNRTPNGIFAITSKVIHPAWTPPGKNIPYGNPENILGTHWLAITPIGSTNPALRGYGIHGTWEPETIGMADSAGCIRMRNEEVEELFDFIPMPRSSQPIVQVTIEE